MKKKYFSTISLSILCAFPSYLMAKDLTSITYSYNDRTYLSWEALSPPYTPIENPLDILEPKDIELMIRFARALTSLNDANLAEEEVNQIQQNLAELRKQLKLSGIDADALMDVREAIIRQRIIASQEPNREIINQQWGVAGFMVPLEFNGTKITEFLLVPTPNACVHTPPPPPNQIILVEYEDGIEFSSLANPIWVEGKLTNTETSSSSVNFIDGHKVIQSVYEMTASKAGYF